MGKEQQALETAKLSAFEKYPILKGLGFQAGFDPDRRGKVEFYSPDEPGSQEDPRPSHAPMGTPYISVRDPKYINPEVFLGEGMHYLPQVDPNFAAFREKIRESMTPEQLAQSRRRYDFYRSDPENPETRPYEDFFEVSDLDAFIRGYISPDKADEWRKSGTYNTNQIKLLEFMKSYLQQGQAK